MKDIRVKMARGATWMVAFKMLERLLALVSTLVLARLLVPADFGLIAMASSLVAILDLFGAFGLDVALIQRQGATHEHYNTAWTLNVAAGAAIASLMLVFAWPLSWYYEEPRLVGIVSVLAIGSLVQGCENIGVVAFRKEMDFRKEFTFLVSKRLAAVAITIPIAVALRSYWALVAGMVGGRLFGVALSYGLHPYRPRPCLTKVREFFGFSSWIFLQNLLHFLKERSADFIVGRIAGPHALGVFSVSAEIASIPGNELIAPINRAIFPAYAKIANDRAALRQEYLSVMGVVCLIAIPAVTGIAAVAPLIIATVLGAKWHDASPILALLAFYGIFQVLLSNAYSAFLAVGIPQVFVRITTVYVVMHLPMLIFLTRAYGLIGAASAHVLASFLILPLSFYLIARNLQIPLRALAATAWRPVAAAAVMYAVVTNAMPVIDVSTIPSVAALRYLAVYVALGAITYISGILALWLVASRPAGAETLLLKQLRATAGKIWKTRRQPRMEPRA